MIHFDRKVKCGADFVALETIEDGKMIEVDGLLLSESASSNSKLGFYKIVDVGKYAEEDYGLKVGDYVLADRLSTFYKSAPICIMRYNNVIVKTNKDRTEYWPLKNMVFVKPEKQETTSGFYVPEALKTGTIVKMNIATDMDVPFKEGDKVLLVKGADYISFGKDDLLIYKPDMLLCKFED